MRVIIIKIINNIMDSFKTCQYLVQFSLFIRLNYTLDYTYYG